MSVGPHTSLSRRRPASSGGLVVLAMLALGCSGGESTGTTGAFTTLGPTAGADTSEGAPDTDDDPPPGTATTEGDTLSGTGEAGGESGGGSNGGSNGETSGDDATDTADASSTTDVEPAAPQPRTGWWSHCVPGISCGDDLVCMVDETETDGACTSACTPTGDATSCAPSPGGTSVPTCLSVSASSICALDCSGGKTCPGGMVCLSDSDDSGPIEICI